MTVVCPSCETRFRDPPSEVLQSRILQCSRCEHEWQVEPGSAARIKVDAPTLSPDLEDLMDNKNAIKTTRQVVMPGSAEKSLSVNSPLYVDRAPCETEKPRLFPVLASGCPGLHDASCWQHRAP